jgi:hypothetical protein
MYHQNNTPQTESQPNTSKPAFSNIHRRQAMTDSPVFKTNRDMIATPRLEAARANAQEASTIAALAVHAVGQRDYELLAMASSASQQPGRQIDALDEQLTGGAL